VANGTRKRGKRPADVGAVVEVRAEVGPQYPVLCLRHAHPRFGVEQLNDKQRSELLLKWSKRVQHSWTELQTHGKHGLGYEMIPASMIKPQCPHETLAQDKYLVFRHQGNLPMIGFKAGTVFHVLWIEAEYNAVYEHGK